MIKTAHRRKYISLSVIALFIALLAQLITLFGFTPLSASAAAEDRPRVVLDPGHGGNDSGTLASPEHYESWYDFKVASYCRDRLLADGRIDVSLTRSGDTNLPLSRRGAAADEANADALISIHFNYDDDRSRTGTQIITSVLPRYSLVPLAQTVRNHITGDAGWHMDAVKNIYSVYDTGDGEFLYYWDDTYNWDVPGDSSRGGLSDYYGLITWACKFGVPSMIIEYAFLSTPSDNEMANRESFLRDVGYATADAIIEYYCGHTHTYAAERTVDYPASCSFAGKSSYHCTVCGHRKDVQSIAASPLADGHLWHAEEYVPATCTRDGYARYICRYEKNLVDKEFYPGRNLSNTKIPTYTETFPAVGHNYVLTASAAVTHTTDGYETYTCTNCGDSYTNISPAEGHSLVTVSTTVADCEKPGILTQRCTVCGEQAQTLLEPAKGHENTLLSESEPTCEKEGERVERCSVCGKETVTPIPATGHTLGETGRAGKDPTCTEDGYTYVTCEVCGALVRQPIKAVGHLWRLSKDENSMAIYVCENDASHTRRKAPTAEDSAADSETEAETDRDPAVTAKPTGTDGAGSPGASGGTTSGGIGSPDNIATALLAFGWSALCALAALGIRFSPLYKKIMN